MIKYFIYCRKSSEEEERQILSIEAQLQELRDYAKQNGLFVIKEFTECQTAKEPGRPIFNQMLSEIDKGNASGIISWNPDRLARNSIDGGRVIYLVDTGKIISLKFPTFWFEATPQGKFMLSVAFGQAKYYTDNLRENILRGIRQKLRRGEFPCKAPLGYFNEPRLRTIEPNQKTFALVKKTLELFASGEFSLTAIQAKMFSLGLVGKDGNKMALSSIQKILTKPFYYGVISYDGELYQGSHKPMISKETFDKIQVALQDHSKSRHKRTERELQFLGFAKCGDCNYAITAERKFKPSGREYVYYRCTHKSKTKVCAERKFVREEELAKQIEDLCQKVSLPDEWKEKYMLKVQEWEKEKYHSLEVFAQNLKDKIQTIKTRLDRLADAYLDQAIELTEYKEKKNKLIEQKAESEEKLRDFERKGNHWLELLKNWIYDANQAGNFVKTKNFPEMRNFLKTAGSNRILLGGKLIMNFQKQYELLLNLPAEARAFSPREVASEQINTLWWT
jgi:site-specific DNA recombinase